MSVELSSNTVSRAGSHHQHPAGTVQNKGTRSHTHGLRAHTQRHERSTRPGPTAPCSLTLRHLWHIHVVHEHQEALSHGRAVRVFGSLLNVCFQVSLDIQRCGAGGEVDYQHNLEEREIIPEGGHLFSVPAGNAGPHAAVHLANSPASDPSHNPVCAGTAFFPFSRLCEAKHDQSPHVGLWHNVNWGS